MLNHFILLYKKRSLSLRLLHPIGSEVVKVKTYILLILKGLTSFRIEIADDLIDLFIC